MQSIFSLFLIYLTLSLQDGDSSLGVPLVSANRANVYAISCYL